MTPLMVVRMAALTFAPSLTFAVLALILVSYVTWRRRRQQRPGYAPLWAHAYVLSIAAAATIAGLVIYAAGGFRHQGKHRLTGHHRRSQPT